MGKESETTRNEAQPAEKTGEQSRPEPERSRPTAVPGASRSFLLGELRHNPDEIKRLFREGTYPYKTRIRKGPYEHHKQELQTELLKVQSWVKETGQKIVVLFEGRDAAGKGGTIKCRARRRVTEAD